MANDTEAPRPDMRDMNKQIAARYRAGEYTANGMPLVLLTTLGRVSGRPHLTPVGVYDDAGQLVVVGSMGGAPTHPQWYQNLLADPTVTVEYRGGTYQARAVTLPDGAERDRLFAAMSTVVTGLPRYQERAAGVRQIPVIVLERTAD
jgi:deazaflavin-dependent oxidoreductase (nitroreductase family)